MTSVKVLVMESERGAARKVKQSLRVAGHEVVRCHEPALPAFPCNGLMGNCPILLHGPIDAAVTVRAHVRATPAPLEDGVVCAIRHGIPVVATGRTVLNPFTPWLAADVPEDDVVATVERLELTAAR